MQILRTGLQLGQAVKNVQRLRQIAGAFAKHGFSDVVERLRLGRFLTARLKSFSKTEADTPISVRFRMALEELGPTFVKLGQVLSTRPDLLPETFIEELSKLQDNVLPISYEVVRATVEMELKGPITQHYAWFDEKPLASASIAQVHEARLHSGEKVVVKVQRPGIARVINTDVSLLGFLAGLLEKYVPESKMVSPTTIVDEFFRTLSFELDFNVEANNIERFRKNFSDMPELVVPKLYKSLCTERVLTMEKFEGIRVTDLKELEKAGIDKKLVVETGARAFFRSVMIHGLFHGDLHAGNLFILPGNRLGIIDFGMVGRLSERARDQLANMLMALITEDYEHLCYQYADLGAAEPSLDFEAFQREVRNTISPYMGLKMAEVNMGRVLIDATKIASKYRIRVPGDWMLVFRAILTIEGMGRPLDPTFDLYSVGQELVKELVRNQYSPGRIKKDLLWLAKDSSALFQTLPRQIRWMFRKFNSDDFAFEFKSKNLEDIQDQMSTNSKRESLATVIAGFYISSAIALGTPSELPILGHPSTSVVLFSLGTLFLLRFLTIR